MRIFVFFCFSKSSYHSPRIVSNQWLLIFLRLLSFLKSPNSKLKSVQLALKASQLMEQTKLSELRSSIARSLSELEMFTEDGESMDTPKRKSAINERMEDLVSAPLAVEDALVGLFDHSDHTLQRRVVESYVRRLYQVLWFNTSEFLLTLFLTAIFLV